MIVLGGVMFALGLYHTRMLPSGKHAHSVTSFSQSMAELWNVIRNFFTKKHIVYYICFMKSKTATIFVSGNECLFLSTSFFLALLHGGSVPIIVGTMNNYVNFLFEIKTQPGVLLRPKR